MFTDYHFIQHTCLNIACTQNDPMFVRTELADDEEEFECDRCGWRMVSEQEVAMTALCMELKIARTHST